MESLLCSPFLHAWAANPPGSRLEVEEGRSATDPDPRHSEGWAHRWVMWCLLLLAVLLGPAGRLPVQAESTAPMAMPSTLTDPDDFGNRIPDFSLAGYRNGGVALPVAPVAERVQPAASGDDSVRIQAAINRVAKLPARAGDGVRGAVLLERGTYRCGATLRVPPGVTLRGEGREAGGSTILATVIPPEGTTPTLIRVEGTGDVKAVGEGEQILDEKVPLGARVVRLADATAFKVGDQVLVERASTSEWIRDLRMDQIDLDSGGVQWTPAGYRLAWSSRVAGVRGNLVALDSPVICSIERRYGGGVLRKAVDSRQGGAAVENLRLESVYQKGKETSDEQHAWNAVSLNRIVDSWVRDVTAVHFAYACVVTGKGSARITVQDCAMLDPVSKIQGGRRYSFAGGGQFVLFQRCYARKGRHDFVAGGRDLGPTVFLDCLAEETYGDIGPHHRWACGQLYDNVRGGQINVQDRGGSGSGHGWAGNCQVFWNCVARTMICQRPWIPGAQNWAVGCIAEKGKPAEKGRPDGLWESQGVPVAPRSLYLFQLQARLGTAAVNAVTTPAQRAGTLWKSVPPTGR